MHISVTEFIELSEHKIRPLYGFKELKSDMKKCKVLEHFSEVSNRLMTNYYGHSCDFALCLAYRKFTKEFMERMEVVV